MSEEVKPQKPKSKAQEKREKREKKNQQVNLPVAGETELDIPAYFITKNKKGKWRLLDPITTSRNLSSRTGETSVKITKKTILKPVLGDIGELPKEELPKMKDFSKKDREKIETLMSSVNKGENKVIEKQSGKTRGRPIYLYKNAKRAGYKKVENLKSYGKNPSINPKKAKEDEKEEEEKPIEPKKSKKSKKEKLKIIEEPVPMPVAVADAVAVAVAHNKKSKKIGKIKLIEEEKEQEQPEPKPKKERAKPLGWRFRNEATNKYVNTKGKEPPYEIQPWRFPRSNFSSNAHIENNASEHNKPHSYSPPSIFADYVEKKYKSTLKKSPLVVPSPYPNPSKTESYINRAKQAIREFGFQQKRLQEDPEWKKILDKGTYGSKIRDELYKVLEKKYGLPYWEEMRNTSGLKTENMNVIIDEGRAEYLKQHSGQGIKEVFSGVVEKVKDIGHKVLHGRNDYPPSFKRLLDKYGNETISRVEIYRQPILSVFSTILNLATKGEAERRLKETDKDKLFHISLWATLSNGKTLLIEKNEVLNMKENPKRAKESESIEAPTPPANLTLREMLEKTKERMGDKFFTYRAIDNNCGNFIENILQANDMDSPPVMTFIKQEAKKILEGFPRLAKAMNLITDIAGRANVVVEGGEIKENIKMSVSEQHYPDWEHMKWGSFTKQFEAYKSAHPKGASDLEAFAKMIIADPSKYQAKTLKRARFYLNVILKKKSHSNIQGKGMIKQMKGKRPPIKSAVMSPEDLAKMRTPRALGSDPATYSPVNKSPVLSVGYGLHLHPALVSTPAHMIYHPNAMTIIHHPLGLGLYAGGLYGGGLYGHGLGGGMEKESESESDEEKEVKGGAIPSPPSRSPITDPSLLGSGLKGRPKKGSPEAKAWGEKMRALRKK